MKALVIYESMFGNTEEVARAVAEGLAEHLEVDVREVSQAASPLTEAVDLIVVGAPTHAFSLSRSSTRADAVKQGATQGEVDTGMRDWLSQLNGGRHAEKVAAFDTRVGKVRHLPGSAARKAEKIAHRHGYANAGTESFFVEDTPGPLLPGEVDRARAWGAKLALETVGRTTSA